MEERATGAFSLLIEVTGRLVEDEVQGTVPQMTQIFWLGDGRIVVQSMDILVEP